MHYICTASLCHCVIVTDAGILCDPYRYCWYKYAAVYRRRLLLAAFRCKSKTRHNILQHVHIMGSSTSLCYTFCQKPLSVAYNCLLFYTDLVHSRWCSCLAWKRSTKLETCEYRKSYYIFFFVCACVPCVL